MNETLAELEAMLDDATTRLVIPLRMSKTLDGTAMTDLFYVVQELQVQLADAEQVPRRLAGKLWYVFTAMLAEASHAREPQPIVGAAWEYAEQLRRVFLGRL